MQIILKKYLSYAWASPLTLFGLCYAGIYNFMGWYRWHGVEGNALVWLVNNDRIPSWLSKYWARRRGHSAGQVVILKNSPDIKTITLKHEQKHVDQALCLGIFWPLFYYGTGIVIKWACPGSDPYYDNPLEIDARRRAGQVVDVVGMTRKFLEKKK